MNHNITKAKALQLLTELIQQQDTILNSRFDAVIVVEWENNIRTVIEQLFDKEHLRRYRGLRNYVKCYSAAGDNDAQNQKYHIKDTKNAVAYLRSLCKEIEDFWEEPKCCAVPLDISCQLEGLFNNFSQIVRQLRKRYEGRKTLDISDEYDVQDLVHSLLWLYAGDVRSEEWTPSYAGKSARMDFLLPEYEIAIEIKMTRKGLGTKEASDQLIIDKEYYKSHPQVKHLICFVYDPEERIENPRGFEKDLSQDAPLKTSVYVRSR